ncbi:hypothetical protein [Citrobacter amalonaticus]|uniref:hypothetical protein n=1 Tax=Citrobacter amalonaticus TaxID=35703 RepID=UPI000A397857|nr:hypothetical protein [Citrobacter amalonaticus]OUE50290.1 hypothetical protein AZ012_004683 [Citrobacter amalonaticus]
MELHTANSEHNDLKKLGIEIQADNIAIECLLCQLIDKELDIDWMESVLYLIQQQMFSMEAVMNCDENRLMALRMPLLSYGKATEAICLKVINEGDQYRCLSEAALTLVKKQRSYIDQLISFIADM